MMDRAVVLILGSDSAPSLVPQLLQMPVHVLLPVAAEEHLKPAGRTVDVVHWSCVLTVV